MKKGVPDFEHTLSITLCNMETRSWVIVCRRRVKWCCQNVLPRRQRKCLAFFLFLFFFSAGATVKPESQGLEFYSYFFSSIILSVNMWVGGEGGLQSLEKTSEIYLFPASGGGLSVWFNSYSTLQRWAWNAPLEQLSPYVSSLRALTCGWPPPITTTTTHILNSIHAD